MAETGQELKEESPDQDPSAKAATLLVVGVLIVVVSSAILAFILYSKISQGS